MVQLPPSVTPNDVMEFVMSLAILGFLVRVSFQFGGMTEAVRELKETVKGFTEARADSDALMAIMRVEIATVRTEVSALKTRMTVPLDG